MKKNLFAIEIAISLILFAMLLAGIFLKEFVVTWLSVGLLVLGGLAIVICKIINLAKSDNQENNNQTSNTDDAPKSKNIFANSKKAWQYSTGGEKIKSILFIFTIMVCCIAFIVLCSYGYINIGLIVLGAGAAVIVIALITMALIERFLYKLDKEQTKIVVIECDEDTDTLPQEIATETTQTDCKTNDTQTENNVPQQTDTTDNQTNND